MPTEYDWGELNRKQLPSEEDGLPDIGPGLNVFGTGRRYREAVVASAETAADLTAILEVGVSLDGASQVVAPFDTLPIEKRTLMSTPAVSPSVRLKERVFGWRQNTTGAN